MELLKWLNEKLRITPLPEPEKKREISLTVWYTSGRKDVFTATVGADKDECSSEEWYGDFVTWFIKKKTPFFEFYYGPDLRNLTIIERARVQHVSFTDTGPINPPKEEAEEEE